MNRKRVKRQMQIARTRGLMAWVGREVRRRVSEWSKPQPAPLVLTIDWPDGPQHYCNRAALDLS